MGRRENGLSLVEILIVVAIVGIVVLVAVPKFSPTEIQKLELAATEVASAIRFARSEATRTGKPHGVNVETAGQRLRVYKLNISGVPEYNVRHPVDKKLYDLVFESDPIVAGVTITNVHFKFVGSSILSSFLDFDATGLPKYDNGITVRMLETATVTLSHGDHQRMVKVEPMTGRVR